MSNFYKRTFNPITKKYERAAWIDQGSDGYRVAFKYHTWTPEDIKLNEDRFRHLKKMMEQEKEG